MIGVVLGAETPQGVEVVGVSPGGPAERAGLQAGDVLVSIRGESLAAAEHAEGPHMGRETVYRVIGEAAPGEALAVVVERDGETWKFDVTPEQREPTSWQSLIRALREIDPGNEVQLAIKRNRKDETLTVTMPENRLGHAWSMQQ